MCLRALGHVVTAAFVDDLHVGGGQGNLELVLDGFLDWSAGDGHGACAVPATEMTESCSGLGSSAISCEDDRGAG